ncbi:MAG: rhodanese-like domain-containing protein [Halothiobacillaceae bacterium]|nr:rhodanese-like domain-containing protein [Halothiobacillaceae bacterium]
MKDLALRLLTSLCLVIGMAANAMAAAPDLRISVNQLADLAAKNNVFVIDARPADEYKQGHIPNARNLPFKSTFQDLSRSGLVVASERAKVIFQSIGLKNDDLVVVYDGSNMVQAARVFWMLEMNGHAKVRLLDGGLSAWTSNGQPLTTVVPPLSISNYRTTTNRNAVKTWVDVQEAIDNPQKLTLIDARDGEHFVGLKSEAHRSGHIPTARNVPVNKNLTADGYLRPRNELRALYGTLPENGEVLVYCSKGLASSLEYFVLRDIGIQVGNYESSWMEWGNKLNLPITPASVTTTAP